MSGDFARRMRDFVRDRVGRIVANDTVIPLQPRPLVVFHILPLSAFELAGEREVPGFAEATSFEPFCGAGFSRINFDGKLAYALDHDTSLGEGYSRSSIATVF